MSLHVLMVCTGNICRSPMAEVFLKEMLPDRLKEKVMVSSAGVSAIDGNHATEKAVAVMDEVGLDLTGHKARFLTFDILQKSDLVLVMEQGHVKFIENFYRSEKEKVHLFSEFCSEKKKKDIPDPYGQSIRSYCKSRDMIESCMAGVLSFLNQLNL